MELLYWKCYKTKKILVWKFTDIQKRFMSEICCFWGLLLRDGKKLELMSNFILLILFHHVLRPLYVESSVIVIFYVIFLMRYAVIINY